MQFNALRHPAAFLKGSIGIALTSSAENGSGEITKGHSVLTKTLLVMRLTIILLLVFVLQTAAKSHAQTVTYEARSVSLKKAFAALEKQTGYVFFYRKEALEGTSAVSVSFKNTPLETALSELLKGQRLGYNIQGKAIFITRSVSSAREKIEMIITTPPITGVVRDADGNPLQGASIRIKGATSGVSTNVNGQFTIDVNPGQILVVSYVGYQPREISISSSDALTIVLEEVESTMEDIVVIGYGQQKRKDLTGAVSSVSQKDLANIPMTRVDKALAGLIPGLDVVPTGYHPGDNMQMRLRGNRSFKASNNPLIIMDGIPFYGSLNDINPYDVASIDVLKDASSTAIYGSQGSNGVIIITTKRGVSGPPKFSFETFASKRKIFGLLPYGNAEQYAERGREAYRTTGAYTDDKTNDALDQVFFDPIEYEGIHSGRSINFPDQLLQDGHQQKYQLTVTGGSNSVKYSVAGGYFNEEDNLPGRAFDRYTLRTNLDFILSSKVTAGTSLLLNYNIIKAKTVDGALDWAERSSPLGKIYNDDGTPRSSPTADAFVRNPLMDFIWDSYRSDNKRWSGSLATYVEVKLFPQLTYRAQLSNNLSLNTISISSGTYTVANGVGLPAANINTMTSNQRVFDNILTYDHKFSNTDHQLKITAVHSYQSSREERHGAAVSAIPFEPSGYYNIGTATTINSVNSDLVETSLESYVGRLFYGYKSKYLLTLTIRADGASRFAPNHKWGYFPSAGAAWKISEENFMKDVRFLSDLKLRLGYGVTGNQAIDPYYSQGGLTQTTYAWDETAALGYRPLLLANKDLRWESTEVYNLGLDFGFLNGRITGSLEVYNTNTYDLLMLRSLPITSGFDNVLENVGSTNNKGFELGLATVNVDNPNFKWNTNLTFSLNREKIVELYNGKADDIGNLWFIGRPIQVFYDARKTGIWQTAEAAEAAQFGRKPGQVKVADISGDGAINDLDREILGSRQPDFIGSMTNQFRFKDFDFSFTTFVRWGGLLNVPAFVPFPGKRYNVLVNDYWTPSNPTNDYPRPDNNTNTGLNATTLGYRDASFIRLKYVSLGYTLPASVFGMSTKSLISGARIYLSSENLLYWTKSNMREYNMDPEWSGTVEPFPAFRTFIAGIDINF